MCEIIQEQDAEEQDMSRVRQEQEQNQDRNEMVVEEWKTKSELGPEDNYDVIKKQAFQHKILEVALAASIALLIIILIYIL